MSLLNTRSVPLIVTSSAITLCDVPPWILPSVSSASWCGSTSRVMTVCTIVMSSAATTMASMPICGVEAWALLPWTVISKSLVCAMR